MSSKPSSSIDRTIEDTLGLLVELIHQERIAENIAKLRPAMFLLQTSCSRNIYSYRLAMGKVISEELAADLAQLLAHKLDKAPAPSSFHNAFIAKIAEHLKSLFDEDLSTLDAAATRLFYTTHDLGNPADRLNWFRQLPAPIVTRASIVATEAQELAEK